MKKTLLLLIALALVTSGCGRFGSKKATPTTLLGEGEVGANLTTPTTGAAAPTTTKATAPVPTAARCPYSDPTSEIQFGSPPRLRLTLTVSPLCPQHANDISFTFKVTNVSSAPIHYDRNQTHFFSLLAYPQGTGRIRWEDNCWNRPTGGGQTAGTLNPGASIDFSSLYPAPKSVSDREKCRRLEKGPYEAHAVFLVCDGDAYTDGYCDIAKDTQYEAHPVLIDVQS